MLWFPKGENYTVGNKSSKKAGGEEKKQLQWMRVKFHLKAGNDISLISINI